MTGYSLFFIMFFVMAFRDLSVGVDTYSYSEMYKSISTHRFADIWLDESNRYIMLYALFMKCVSYLSDSYFLFQAVFSMVYSGLIVRFLLKNTNDIFFCGLIYICCGLYLGTFNIQRQMLAVAILMNGWCYIVDEKKWKAVLLLAIAGLIHLTAFVFLFAYFSYLLCKKYKLMIKVLPIIMLVISMGYSVVLQYSSQYLLMFNNYLDNHKGTQEAGGIYIIWCVISLLSLYLVYFSGKKTSTVSKLAGVFSLQFVFANLVGMEFNYLERLGTYFLPFTLIVYEQIWFCIKNKHIASFYKIAVGVCYLFYYYLSFNSEQYHYKLYF